MSNSNTAVPSVSINDAGVIAPSEQDILTGVQADINAALGGNANQDLRTPQGQLATSETAIIGDANDQLLALFNGFDPRNATGRMQDAIGYIYFMLRKSGESRAEFELRRAQSVAANSVGVNAAILTKILNVSGVSDAYVIDNPSSSSVTVSGVTLNANSIYCSVYGGVPADIARAIISKKPPGCAYTGGTTVSVQDQSSVYGGNGPSYSVAFDFASATSVFFQVSLKNSTLVPSNALDLIQAAIISVFTGQTGNVRARIGSAIYASSYYAAIAALGDWVQIENIKVGLSSNPTSDVAQMQINQFPVTSANTISLTLV